MPATITIDTKVAAGHNNAGGLALVSAIADANGVYCIMPRTLSEVGLPEQATNGLTRFRGYPSVVLVMPMLVAQYVTLLTTYTGKVTLRTSLNGGITYANYNAFATLPQLAELDSNKVDFAGGFGVGMPSNFTGPGWPAVEWTMTKLVAL